MMQVSLPTQYNEGNQKPVGALSELLSKLKSGATQGLALKEGAREVLKTLPEAMKNHVPIGERQQIIANRMSAHGQNVLTEANNTNFFQGLGFNYIGPIDGHNVEELVALFEGKHLFIPCGGHVAWLNCSGYCYLELSACS